MVLNRPHEKIRFPGVFWSKHPAAAEDAGVKGHCCLGSLQPEGLQEEDRW